MKKGDVLTIAQLAGIMGAKRTSELIPLCHPLPLNKVDVDLELDEVQNRINISATASTSSKTGVEMEALTAVSVAALTVYDMCKGRRPRHPHRKHPLGKQAGWTERGLYIGRVGATR